MSGSAATVVTGGEPIKMKSDAAVKVQSVFRGNRTRRALADSAVMAQENWAQMLQFANLNRTTTSFFESGKPETAISRWCRVGSNASKLGKGLSKDDKAQQLIFQHWIEAVDPKHRYGKNLHVYYDEWSKTEVSQPFFYWLDIGGGKDVDVEKCARSKLKNQCVKYLGPKEREIYEYTVSEGKIKNKLSGEMLNTETEGGWDVGMLFVMSPCKRLYIGEKIKGKFHHSSFLSGGATIVAGAIVAEDGILKSIAPFTGHYKTSDERLQSFLTFFKENGVNLDEVRIRKSSEYFFPEEKSFNSREAITKLSEITKEDGISAS